MIPLTEEAIQELNSARYELRKLIEQETFFWIQSKLLNNASSVEESLRIQQTSKDTDVLIFVQAQKTAREAGEHYRILCRKYNC